LNLFVKIADNKPQNHLNIRMLSPLNQDKLEYCKKKEYSPATILILQVEIRDEIHSIQIRPDVSYDNTHSRLSP
jgi:hypothetical protein